MPRIANLQQLRQGLGEVANSYSDEELLSALAHATGMDLPSAAVKFGYDEAKGPWSEQGSASIDSYQAGMYGVGEAVSGAVGADSVRDFFGRRRRANEIASSISIERAKQGGIPQNWDEVDGVGSAARYVGGLALQSAPYVAEAAVGGVAGRLATMGARAALTPLEAARLGQRAALAGGVTASYPSSVGDILQNQREQAGQTDLGAAAALGVPYAALNAFGLESLAARGRLPEHVFGRYLNDIPGVRGGVARAAATGAGLAVSEGASEAGQEVANQLGRMSVDPGASLTSQDALKRYLDSFVGGAALGGVFGGGAGGWRRSSSPMEPLPTGRQDEPGVTQDLLALPFNPLAGTPIVFPDGTVALGSEAAFDYRYRPQASPQPMSPYDAGVAAPGQPAGPYTGAVQYEPIDALSLTPDEMVRVYTGGIDPGDWEAALNRGVDTGGMQLAPPGRFPQQAYTPEPNISTQGLSYEGQNVDPGVGYDGSRPDLALAPQGSEAATAPAGIPFQYDTGSLALAPQGQAAAQGVPAVAPPAATASPTLPQQVAPGSGTAEAAAALAKTQQRKEDAADMIQRAKAAGMESDKQQTIFWQAEALAKDSKLDEGKMTQVVALLMQSKYAKAQKLLEEATTAPQPTTATAAAPAVAAESAKPTANLEEVEIVGEQPATTGAAAPAEAPTIASAANAEPQTLAQRVKQSAARAGKLKRYETLLACLSRK